ncbi:hypothetical protein CRUP_033379 [Coryphaenoides rupestris]|nr:hypothetical protein CRUP_033379 [Coryphaenoides rupestris]
MDKQRKRRLTFFTIGLLFLLSGVEYGNFMYFMGYSKWLLLCSRLVAGVGAGAGSSIFGFLTRCTRADERAGVFAAIMAFRQAGLLIGPAFNMFLRLCDFKLGPFVVDKYTSPGGEGEGEGEVLLEMKEEEEETLPLVAAEEAPVHRYLAIGSEDSSEAPPGGPPPPDRPRPPARPSVVSEFLREEVLVLLTAQFITLFNQTALETMVTPMTQRYFGFTELGNSLMYAACGVEVILGFFLVRWLSGRVADRAVLAAGLAICGVACVWCLVFLTELRGGYRWEMAAFVIGVFLQLLGLPFVAVSQVSLFSKVTAEKTQGFSQGVRRSVGGLGTILGPLWAGGLTNNLYIMTALSYQHLTEPRSVECAEGGAEESGCVA